MNRRGFLGALLGAAVAPKVMFAVAKPVAFFGGRVEFYRGPPTVFRPPEYIRVMKLYTNPLYGKFGANTHMSKAA
jgi:hypothetical protein